MDREAAMEKAIRTALKSAQMEGFQITPKVESDCRRIVRGEISITEYTRRIKENQASDRRVDLTAIKAIY